jgi:hypothetical protein
VTTFDYDKADQTRLTDNYPNAYSDTYGLRSGRGFIFKTGPAWPKGEVPYGRPLPHELRPVNDHPITPVWDDILTRIETRLKEDKLPFTAVMPLAFANVGEGEPFCPLVVAIGVEPTKVAFEDAKTVAESVTLILVEAGFDDVEVAIWEFETFLSGLNLPALDPVLYGSLTKFHHPFTSTLGIPVAPFKQPICSAVGNCSPARHARFRQPAIAGWRIKKSKKGWRDLAKFVKFSENNRRLRAHKILSTVFDVVKF